MKAHLLKGLILFFVGCSTQQIAAQEFTLTTSKSNLVASKATIEVRELSGNANAIIIATPLGDTEKTNPHPIGAWYYSGNWNIFNTDHATMPPGLTFKVQYFLKSGVNEFVHVVTRQSLVGEGSYIDSPALNGKPHAQFKIFQNHAPDDRTGYLNKYEATAVYDPAAGKWFIKNVNGERLFPNTAYNIVITSSGASVPVASMPTATPYVPVIPLTVVSEPLTVVVREEFTLPAWNLMLSPGYCKAPIAIYTNPSILITDTVIVTGQYEDGLAQLRWSALVSNGSVLITLCNNSSSVFGSSVPLNTSYRKVNILVLR